MWVSWMFGVGRGYMCGEWFWFVEMFEMVEVVFVCVGGEVGWDGCGIGLCG